MIPDEIKSQIEKVEQKKTEGLTIAAACEAVGMKPSKYHYYRWGQGSGKKKEKKPAKMEHHTIQVPDKNTALISEIKLLFRLLSDKVGQL